MNIIIIFAIIIAVLLFVWYKRKHPINIKHYSLLKNEKIETFSKLKEQGHCNVNYLIETKDKKYLLRNFKYDGNRQKEFYFQNLAYKKNIAAKAFLLDEKNNLMICNFIEGEHQNRLNQHTLKKLALTLQKLHRIRVPTKAYNFKSIFKLKDKKALQAFRVIETFKPEYVFGHNDLHPKNILFGKKIQFIDWEYAGRTDRYFDLAAIIIEFKLNKQDEQTFLQSYFKRSGKVKTKKLEAFKVVYQTLWTIWFGNLERGQITTIS